MSEEVAESPVTESPVVKDQATKLLKAVSHVMLSDGNVERISGAGKLAIENSIREAEKRGMHWYTYLPLQFCWRNYCCRWWLHASLPAVC